MIIGLILLNCALPLGVKFYAHFYSATHWAAVQSPHVSKLTKLAQIQLLQARS
jgi:hypothetical protein